MDELKLPDLAYVTLADVQETLGRRPTFPELLVLVRAAAVASEWEREVGRMRNIVYGASS